MALCQLRQPLVAVTPGHACTDEGVRAAVARTMCDPQAAVAVAQDCFGAPQGQSTLRLYVPTLSRAYVTRDTLAARRADAPE